MQGRTVFWGADTERFLPHPCSGNSLNMLLFQLETGALNSALEGLLGRQGEMPGHFETAPGTSEYLKSGRIGIRHLNIHTPSRLKPFVQPREQRLGIGDMLDHVG